MNVLPPPHFVSGTVRTGRAIDIGLLVALCVGLLSHVVMLAHIDADIAGVFLRALLIASLMSLIPISVVWFLDRRERENPWMLAAAFLWGGLVATTLSLPLNAAAFALVDHWAAQNPVVIDVLGPDAASLIAAPLSAPVVEEFAKGVGVCMILWIIRDKFDGVRDGFIYGALVGAGFNWFEAPLYIMQGFAEHGTASYGRELGVRHGLLGLGGHALFTGVFGIFLGIAAQTSRHWLRVVAPIVGMTIAVAAHLLNNIMPLLQTIATISDEQMAQQQAVMEMLNDDIRLWEAMLMGSIPQLTIFLPLTILVLIAIWRSGCVERRIVRETLASEVERFVTPREYEEIVQDRALRTRRGDPSQPKLARLIVRAQNELAFRKHRVMRRGADPEADASVREARQAIERLRALSPGAS